MTLNKLYNILDSIAPFQTQDEWDNSGVIIGDIQDTNKLTAIYASLDITKDNITKLVPNSAVIVHHPLIFKGIKNIDNRYPNNLIKELINKNISVIAMHTNFDKSHFTKYIVEKVLKKEIIKIEKEYLYHFEVNEKFDTFLTKIQNIFELKYIKYTKNLDFINTAVILNGSGGEFVPQIHNADCFLTGDIKYHQAIEAINNNLSLIDIRHYESEKFFATILEEILKDYGIKAIIMDCKNPFEYKGKK